MSRRHPAVAVSALVALAATATATAPPAGAALPAAPSVNNSTRAGALAAYNSYYLPALQVPSGSTGHPGSCSPGTVSTEGRKAGLTVINYFRGMAKLAPVTLNSSWSSSAQSAALIMAANNTLNHYPTKSMRCYSAAGAAAAGTGNLALGLPTIGQAENLYMDEAGNAATLGHRRWLMSSSLTQVGIGQVGAANSTKMFEKGRSSARPSGPAYTAWPAAGYVPMALAPSENTWSFSAKDTGVDMSRARVTVRNGSAAIPTRVTHLPNGYGNPAVEFSPATGYRGGVDRAFTITVSGMKKGKITLPAYTYTTTLFDQTRAVTSPTTPSR